MTVRQHRLSVPAYPSDYIYPADKDYPLNEDWEAGPVALLDTSEGLFNQAWNLTYDPTPPPAYDPAMQQFDGSTGFYDDTITTSGTQLTVVGRFSIDSFTGDIVKYITRILGATSNVRLSVAAISSDFTGFPNRHDRLQFSVTDTSGTQLALIFTSNTHFDGDLHVFQFAYDGTAGTASLFVDEVNDDDVGNGDRVLITGTVESGLGTIAVGSTEIPDAFWDGQIGYFGYKDDYLTNASDFMSGSNPRQLNEVVWTEWNGQPAFWKDTGAMDASIGTDGVMTKNGTITEIPPLGGFQSFTVTPEDTGPPVVVLAGVDSVQCALGFDQNAHVTIAWIDSVNQGHLYWFDTTVGDWIITDFQTPIGGIGLTLDDKRFRQTGASDVLLWYTIPVGDHHEIYTREQRDRYSIAYPMQPPLPVWAYFKKLGMHKELRVQMTMTNTGPT